MFLKEKKCFGVLTFEKNQEILLTFLKAGIFETI